jgi:predicted Rossmann fold nucleotide-binding protein DprA/Smf involved in DNA uptake
MYVEIFFYKDNNVKKHQTIGRLRFISNLSRYVIIVISAFPFSKGNRKENAPKVSSP